MATFGCIETPTQHLGLWRPADAEILEHRVALFERPRRACAIAGGKSSGDEHAERLLGPRLDHERLLGGRDRGLVAAGTERDVRGAHERPDRIVAHAVARSPAHSESANSSR